MTATILAASSFWLKFFAFDTAVDLSSYVDDPPERLPLVRLTRKVVPSARAESERSCSGYGAAFDNEQSVNNHSGDQIDQIADAGVPGGRVGDRYAHQLHVGGHRVACGRLLDRKELAATAAVAVALALVVCASVQLPVWLAAVGHRSWRQGDVLYLRRCCRFSSSM